jgi:hypothetical protein
MKSHAAIVACCQLIGLVAAAPCSSSMYTRRVAVRATLSSSVALWRTDRASAASTTAADVAYAVADVAACKAAVRTIENLARYESFRDAAGLTTRPPLTSFGAAVLVLSEAPGLNNDQKQEVGSAGIEVLTSLSGLTKSLRAEDALGARANARRAQAGLDQVLASCRQAGLYD